MDCYPENMFALSRHGQCAFVQLQAMRPKLAQVLSLLVLQQKKYLVEVVLAKFEEFHARLEFESLSNGSDERREY